MKADRGAWSMLFNPVRRKKSAIVRGSDVGKGNRRTAVEDGRWVKTIVLIRPRRCARGPANIVESEERR